MAERIDLILGKKTPVRFAFANVLQPNEDGMYDVCILISKDSPDAELVKKKVQECATAPGAFGGKPKKSYKKMLRDGDEEREEYDGFPGHYFFNAKTKFKPQVIDTKGNRLIDAEQFYSGCYGRVQVNLYTYDRDGNAGVTAGLGHIQKTQDGERFGGVGDAASVFEIEDEDDDMLS